jgi:hypothetical protein
VQMQKNAPKSREIGARASKWCACGGGCCTMVGAAAGTDLEFQLKKRE